MLDTFDEESIGKLYEYLENDGKSAVLSIIAHIPADRLPQFTQKCLKIMRLFKSSSTDEHHQQLLSCLFAWNLGHKVEKN
jgi:hypothetical protein